MFQLNVLLEYLNLVLGLGDIESVTCDYCMSRLM